MSMSSLKPGMGSVIRKVSEQIGLSEQEARLLLSFYEWRSERLLEAWVDSSERVREVVGLSKLPDPPPFKPAEWAGKSLIMCLSSLDEYPPQEFDACPCGHFFSKDSWKSCLEAAMTDPIMAQLSRCLNFPSCKELVRPRMFREYLSPEMFERWERFGVRRYAASCRHISQCPGEGCEYAVVRRDFTRVAEDVRCDGGHLFCFACGENGGHSPATCASVELWKKRNLSEGDSAMWIVQNTKACPNPKCKRQIERSSGCNKVVCTHCQTAMCYACGLEYYKEAGHA